MKISWYILIHELNKKPTYVGYMEMSGNYFIFLTVEQPKLLLKLSNVFYAFFFRPN